MTYMDQLHPWCIIHLLPKMQRTVVARFRRHGDAEAHLRVLRRLSPGVTFMLIFDPALRSQNTAVEKNGE